MRVDYRNILNGGGPKVKDKVKRVGKLKGEGGVDVEEKTRWKRRPCGGGGKIESKVRRRRMSGEGAGEVKGWRIVQHRVAGAAIARTWLV